MTDTPKNHGHITGQKTPSLPPVRIPRRFQGKIFTSYSDFEKSDGHNGLLEAKALQDVLVRGRNVKAGEVFKTGANEVVELARRRLVEIIDDRMEAEEKVVAEAQRLGLGKAAMLEATDFPEQPQQRERKGNWATKPVPA